MYFGLILCLAVMPAVAVGGDEAIAGDATTTEEPVTAQDDVDLKEFYTQLSKAVTDVAAKHADGAEQPSAEEEAQIIKELRPGLMEHFLNSKLRTAAMVMEAVMLKEDQAQVGHFTELLNALADLSLAKIPLGEALAQAHVGFEGKVPPPEKAAIKKELRALLKKHFGPLCPSYDKFVDPYIEAFLCRYGQEIAKFIKTYTPQLLKAMASFAKADKVPVDPKIYGLMKKTVKIIGSFLSEAAEKFVAKHEKAIVAYRLEKCKAFYHFLKDGTNTLIKFYKIYGAEE